MVTLNEQSLKQWQEEDLEDKRYEYDLKPGDYVLDIGSYKREFGRQIEEKYIGCRVEYFDALDNRAAWIFTGKQWFSGAYYYTSMYGEGDPVQKDCYDISEWLQTEVALCKINIEGGEYYLLDYIIETGLIKNIKYLQVQFHLIEGQDCENMYEGLKQRLLLTHKIDWQYPFCWESWSRL